MKFQIKHNQCEPSNIDLPLLPTALGGIGLSILGFIILILIG